MKAVSSTPSKSPSTPGLTTFLFSFLQILLPCDQQYLRAAASQRSTYTVSPNEFLPYDVERAMTKLVQRELAMAGQVEMLKQDLATAYDFNLENCYRSIDDCNFGFIDTSNLKRFLVKCCIYASDALLISIIRRMDLDADARLSKREFFDGIQPQENFTKGSLTEMKKSAKKQSRTSGSASNFRKMTGSMGKRPMTAATRNNKSPSPYGMTGTFDRLQPSASNNEKDFLSKNNHYSAMYAGTEMRNGQLKQKMMSSASSNGRKDNMAASSHAQSQNRDEIDVRPKSPRRNKSRSPLRTNPPEVFSRSPRSNRHYEDEGNGQLSQRSARNHSPRNNEDRP